jgi:RNA polymerase sigma factor (sigma-70 family)
LLTPPELIAALQRGEAAAYRQTVVQFGDRVYNTVLSMVQQQEDAEDLVQEVFLEVYQSVHQFRGEAKLSTWIYRIAVTKSLEFLRKKNRQKRRTFVQALFGEDSLDPIVDIPSFQHPGIQLENKERAAVLFAAIDKLPEKQKAAYTLHKIEELSYVEVADVLKTTVSSVESLLFRSKQNLQKLLSDYYNQDKQP